jgi:hypothetical protein
MACGYSEIFPGRLRQVQGSSLNVLANRELGDASCNLISCERQRIGNRAQLKNEAPLRAYSWE